MTKDDIDRILEHFTIYTTKDYVDSYMCGQQQEVIGKMYHNEEDFYLVIFTSGEVYQLNSDHERQGIELKTIKQLETRFKSFTGEKLFKG